MNRIESPLFALYRYSFICIVAGPTAVMFLRQPMKPAARVIVF
jgi:hypothetical protein